MAGLVFQGLGKFEFLRRNRDELADYRRRAGETLRARYGANAMPVTVTDTWVITNCEGGITRGKIDPDFRHSLGEIGLFPLPSNISDWNGPDAPAWDRPMPIEVNVFQYLLYLGHLKNRNVKRVDGLALYRDLFSGHDGSAGEVLNAKILAGVVHGYFFSGNYANRQVPLQFLIDGYRNDVSLSAMMSGTGYVHAGTSIVANRETNINDALEALQNA